MGTLTPLQWMDPQKVAHAETLNWIAYYQKRWLPMLRVSVQMVQETYRLNWWQSLYGAYLIARADRVRLRPLLDSRLA